MAGSLVLRQPQIKEPTPAGHMRVCLVSSVNLGGWYDREREPTILSLPLGLLSLAAVLEQSGHEVAILDFNYALAKGELSLDGDFYANAAKRIEAARPQVVGFSTMCNSYHIALRMAEAVRAGLPLVPIVFGGPQASVVDRETLEVFSFVDMVLRGESEQTLPLLLAGLERGIIPQELPGLTYRDRDRVVRNSDTPLLIDLDSLPVPAYHLFPYGVAGAPAIDVGRGCPFACTFCSTSGFWGRRFRLKSIDRIVQEMWMLKKEYGATCFSLMHDLFTVNRKRLHEFCARLQLEKMDVTWTCSARVDCVDAELLRHMADSGCRAVFYGVESGSARMQREIGKNLRLDQVWSAVDGTLAADMSTTLSFIAGFPRETEDDLRQSMVAIQSLIERPQVNVQMHLLAPQTGTLDYHRYGGSLAFDGYYSDIADAACRFLEPEWFRQSPALFSSFYYFQTPDAPRTLLRGLDLFVHGPCSVMRETVLNLLKGTSNLWQLYREWRVWADGRCRGGGPIAGQNPDEFLLDFYDFASERVKAGHEDFDLGRSRDEILAFYLQYYGQTPVRFVKSTTADTPAPPAENMEVTHGVHDSGLDARLRM